MTYRIRISHSDFLKRRYDPWGGNVASIEADASTWKTLRGANAFAERFRKHFSSSDRARLAETIRVEEIL